MKTRKKTRKKRQKTNETRKKIYDRKKMFYIGSYIAGYALSLMKTGVPNLIYLVPLKLFALYISITIGNVLYMGSIGKTRGECFSDIIKSMFLGTIIIVLGFQMQKILFGYGIDIEPLIGI